MSGSNSPEEIFRADQSINDAAEALAQLLVNSIDEQQAKRNKRERKPAPPESPSK